VYRDLKPENILLDSEGHVRLTDFGLSKGGLDARGPSTDGLTNSFVGTTEYLAPEVFRNRRYSYSVDWYSLGLVIYEMLSGINPFKMQEPDPNIQIDKILNSDIPMFDIFSDEACQLIVGLVQKKPEDRIGCTEEYGAREIKMHPWFRGIDWDKMDRKEIPAPFKPNVKNAEDTGNIDEIFLNEDPDLSDEDTILDFMKPKGPIKYDNFTFINEIKKPSTNSAAATNSDTASVSDPAVAKKLISKASFLDNKNTTFTIDADGNVTVKNKPESNNEGKEQKQF